MKAPRASKLVVVIEDDPLVLEATGGLLRSWGCRVVAAESYGEAMRKLSEIGQRPDLIVCDYRLPQGPTGVDAIEMLRDAFEIPRFSSAVTRPLRIVTTVSVATASCTSQ